MISGKTTTEGAGPGGDPLGERIRAFLDAQAWDQAELLGEIVKTPSDNPPGDCAPIGEKVATLLEGLGLTVERHVVPEAQCWSQDMLSAVNLVARDRFGDGPAVALHVHGDVVPPGEGWMRNPYGAEIHDGMMYGRGVAVSKSVFATFTFSAARHWRVVGGGRGIAL